ncbi:hypothetical protein GCG54_00014250 [Colletotrichum gloeosporioides]|uniref:Uncharacterized protein n=1 Tax=Colletotrichum gloeosporioides TaxID=474922 RepID=A0A8H4FG42_COLGL|nr:uncharacterized protein GCG54_00014250 [Colletotrichum gloeosporioides]KAF3800451.1 hypothetical protein GCG54_00014250 [Colletotrichum gloeosporioides]
MSQSPIRLVLFYLSWFAVAAKASMTLERRAIRRQQSDSSHFCSVKTCGAAGADTCDQQLNTRVLGAPDRGSQPGPGRWADPTNYGGNVDSFFRGEVAKLQWSQQDIVSINGADVTSKYIPFKNEPKSLAALGFCGCVGVIVMSRSAVWMAHITEEPVLTNEATFKRNGLDVLENGSGTDDMYYGLADLKDNVFAANQDPVIVVFAPKDESGEFKYRNLMAQVDDLVENLIPVRSKWIGYTPMTGGMEKYDTRCTTSNGKLLVQYQPSHSRLFGKSDAKARIWVEGSRWTYESAWKPQSDQKASS